MDYTETELLETDIRSQYLAIEKQFDAIQQSLHAVERKCMAYADMPKDPSAILDDLLNFVRKDIEEIYHACLRVQEARYIQHQLLIQLIKGEIQDQSISAIDKEPVDNSQTNGE